MGAASARVALALVAALIAACGTPRPSWRASWRAPYAEFDPELREAFSEARAAMDAGRLRHARGLLATLAAAHPDNVELGAWLQDVELALLERGELFAGDLAQSESPEDALRQRYAEAVRETPSVAGYVLAARLETDAIAAEIQLERALELDPGCAWAHYGRAHALLRQRTKVDRWRQARACLSVALELDPGFVRARWLEAWMLAQEGAGTAATYALDAWLRETRGDPRVTDRERHQTELDLAMARILDGDPRGARELLLTLEGTTLGRPRRLAMLAVAEHELGDLEAALDAARRAEDASAGDLLPLVQQAMVFQYGLEEREGALASWRRVRDAAGGEGDLAAMLQGLRAQVELERAAARAR